MSGRMLSGAVLVMLVFGAEAAAQPRTGCAVRATRPAVGATLGMIAGDRKLDGDSFPRAAGEGLGSSPGRGLSITASAPLGSEFVFRMDAGIGRAAVKRGFRDQRPPYDFIGSRNAGHLDIRQYTVSVIRYNIVGDLYCPYYGGGLGHYAFNANGAEGQSLGVFGVIGAEFAVGPSRTLGVELGFHIANNDGQAPLNEVLVLMARPAVVYRRHF